MSDGGKPLSALELLRDQDEHDDKHCPHTTSIVRTRRARRALSGHDEQAAAKALVFKLPDLPGLVDGHAHGRGTLLHLACAKGDLHLVRYAVEDLDVPIDDEIEGAGTSLHVACSCGHSDVVAYLLSRQGARALVNQPVRSYGNESPLQCAVGVGSIDCARAVIAAGASLKYVDGTGSAHNAVARALDKNHLQTAKWLVCTFGKDIADITKAGKELSTIARSPPLDVAKLRFVVTGCGLEPTCVYNGWTLIMGALYTNRNEEDKKTQASTIQWLQEAIALGADPTVPNRSGDSPAKRAREFGLDEVAAFLERACKDRGPSAKRQRV